MNPIPSTEVVKSPDLPTPQTEDTKYRRLGWSVLAILVGVFGVWASFAPLESAVAAPGKVIVASNNRIIQHLEGGIVKTILVKDGNRVARGESLIVLDDTQATAQLKVVEAQYYELLGLEARLIAEREGAGIITFPSELFEAQNLSNRTITENQRREFSARARALADQKTVLLQRVEQLRNQIAGYKALIESKSGLARSYRDEVKELEVLFQQQLIDKMRLRDAKRQLLVTEGEIANAKTEIARAGAQIDEVNAQIISQKQEFLKDLLAQLSDTQAKLSDLRARKQALSDTLVRTNITTPVSGTVTNLSIHTVGGVIAPGKPILEIVPEGEPLIVEGRVAATESMNVHIGLKAEVRFPSFSHVKSLKEVEGEVIHIGADTVADETTKALFYPVKIRITKEGEAELRRNRLSIQPGIPADAMIVTASRTFADYLIHPIKMMFKKSFNEQ